jgi:hypothetical protein
VPVSAIAVAQPVIAHYEARTEHRGGRIVFEASDERGIPGAGTVHHVAWSVLASEIADWRPACGGGWRPPDSRDRPLLV